MLIFGLRKVYIVSTYCTTVIFWHLLTLQTMDHCTSYRPVIVSTFCIVVDKMRNFLFTLETQV